MGAEAFIRHVETDGENAEEAFRAARSQVMCSGPYTGTVASKYDYTVVHDGTALSCDGAVMMAEEILYGDDGHPVDDKHAPAGMIRVTDGWVVFGVAPS